ncbi:hypothetical protein FNO01nite_11240 [Flavobacterium noncentrifugens]|uniref:AhpC/TSA family protein n=1 Tax=Flavobacterium noncentrifugens TaxID=1128970 RepID=A0A1G8VFQ3_9FLAO|nr:redoxin domain-containing protein [Flavobacterium noncentrifugens]GEP50452.1 hypothetical protein FNO01nite_11240 [Flavobacterium noncentrifugens]SDJ63970.1 AhpC/TSA family protein [Flavobacterium noncentrifugens]
MKKAWIFIIIAVLGITGFYAWRKMAGAPDIRLENIALQNLSGLEIDLAQRNSQKPMIITFWSVSSKDSKDAFLLLKNAYAKHGSSINFMMVSDDEIEEITTFKMNYRLPFYFARSVKPLDDYNIYNLPTVYFFNAAGKLVSKKSGLLTQAEIETEISKID